MVRRAIMTIFKALKSLLHDRIHQLLNDAIAFNSNDNLVHLDESDHRLLAANDKLSYPELDVPKKLIKEIKDEIKEKGVNPLCLVTGIVELELKGKTFMTPVRLTPLQLHHDKVRSTVSFSHTNEPFINPYLVRTLQSEFELDPSGIDPHNIFEWILEKGFKLRTDLSFVGNFHHHRYAIVRELEDLLKTESFSESLLDLFGEFEEDSQQWNISSKNLLAADIDHEAVFKQLGLSSTIVQGPPGTGKTQVLVNIIGKMLLDRKRLTVISEKHVALEVVFNKLVELGLSPLAYIAASEHSNTAFIRSLEDSWKFFEESEVKETVNLQLSEQYEQRLQLVLDTINRDELAGGISYSSFLKYYAPFKHSEYSFRSIIPGLTEFEKFSATIREIYRLELSESVGCLKPFALTKGLLPILDQMISHWQNKLSQLCAYFEIEKWLDLEMAMKTAADLQIFENELIKKYGNLIEPDSANRKKFERLYKKWLSHPLREHPLAVSSHWKQRPDEIEINSLRNSLKGGFFEKRKASRRWKQLSHLPIGKADEAIAEELLIRAQEDSLSQLKVKFCGLGIENPYVEVDQVNQLLHYLTREKWELFVQFDENERSQFRSFHETLRNLYDELQLHLRLKTDQPLHQQLEALRSNLGHLIQLPEIADFSSELLQLIGTCLSWEQFQSDLFHSHKILLEKTYPTLKGFDPHEIGKDLDEIITLQESESHLLVNEILFDKKSLFAEYNTLLTTSARKLNEEEKTLKQKLKRGKSILVKEFGKSRQHLSLRELFSTEAKYWIQLLKPIWLSNPSFVAKSLPLEKSLFDIAIFDESTQIPLQNVLGVLQRSDRALVAGDEHQMGPANYFSTTGSEIEDLLHQASFHYSPVSLKHHYRSKYPDLIRFSNHHFYNGELLVYPTPNTPDNVLNYVYIPDGRFVDRKNVMEAKAVAEKIRSALEKSQKIGVVAFSEEQLNTIINELNSHEKDQLEERIEHSGWFCKSLENLQGDECDHLVISFGYAKNQDGEFHHRFGPMNLHSGRNRLNVLMTRAREEISLFTSVESSTFKVSENESVNLLRQLLAYFENYRNTKTHDVFPYALKPEISGLEIRFDNIYDQFRSARELVTLHSVLKHRGWKITYH